MTIRKRHINKRKLSKLTYIQCVKIPVMKMILLRWPGVEPGSTAWKAAMLTAIPPTLDMYHH